MRSTILLLAALGFATPALAGPPWIRASLPADHVAARARGGFILLHTFHHGTPALLTLTGTAETIVGHVRRSVPLRFVVDTSEAGLIVVPQTWPAGGPWVLNVANADLHGGAGLVVGIDASGQPVLVEMPRTATGQSRPATEREVVLLLEHLAGARAAPTLQDGRWRVIFTPPGATLLAVLLLPALLIAWAVRRGRRLSGSPLAERRLPAAG